MVRHIAIYRYGANCKLKLKDQEAQKTSNKNGSYRFINIFLICWDENIYLLIVLFFLFLFTSISIKLSRFFLNLLSIAFSSFQQHFPTLKFFFFIYQKGSQWKYSVLAFLRYPSHHNIFKLYFHFICSKFVVNKIDLPTYLPTYLSELGQTSTRNT